MLDSPIAVDLAASIQTKVDANLGKAFETVVFLELKRRFEQVSYWRDNKSQVDFVVHQSGAIPTQVTLEL